MVAPLADDDGEKSAPQNLVTDFAGTWPSHVAEAPKTQTTDV